MVECNRRELFKGGGGGSHDGTSESKITQSTSKVF